MIRRESSDSDPGTITVDGKKMFEEQHMSQLITTNVVSSFGEHNLHKQENPIVPSLMLNSHWVAVSLYDCINNYLIVSERIDLYDEEWVLKDSVLLFIWLFINHRYVVIHRFNSYPFGAQVIEVEVRIEIVM